MKYFLTALAFLTTPAIARSGFSEPPAVLYGKVIHVSNGASYQVFDGSLEVTLANPDNLEESVTLSTILTPTGASDSFSYRLEVPQSFLPTSDQASLSVGSAPSTYLFHTIEVDGLAAEPLDSSQALLTTSFSSRAQEHRLDLKVSLPQPDSDNDEIPDWWEELHGLNPLFAGDATEDPDGDTLDNRNEFNRGTDPGVSNLTPTLISTNLFVPAGGTGGLYLQIIDVDTAPAEISVRYRNAVPGIAFYLNGTPVAPDIDFTYADILAGAVTVFADPSFSSANVTFEIGGLGKQAVLISAFSPATLPTTAPALWLDAGNFISGSNWPDATPAARDAYQPYPASQPSSTALDGTSKFFYIDDRDLSIDSGSYSAFAAFEIKAFRSEDSTLFRHSDLLVSIGGTNNTEHAQSLIIGESGRETPGPALPTSQALQVTLNSTTANTSLAISGTPFSFSSPTHETLTPSFTTLGASHEVAQSGASNFFNGSISEFILYNSELDPGPASRVEDYQLSRWNAHTIWDLRSETSPLNITGTPNVRNSINGGWAADTLTGGNLDDILRGGPGDNTLTGASGADRFQFFPDLSNDTITDFTEDDSIDLTAIFGTATGTPDTYLNILVQAYRDENGLPAVRNILELDFDGDGGTPDQTITLAGGRYNNTDLPRLVGENIIQLGGPHYPTTLAFEATATDITETLRPRTLTLTRSGNLADALTVPISFGGSAEIQEDYQVSGAASVNGVVIEAQFARGEATTSIDLTPVQDMEEESEQIIITPLYLPQLTSAPIQLNLHDAPTVSLEALASHALRSTSTPGTIRVSRSGPVTEALDINFTLSGSAINGIDYQEITTAFTFPIGLSEQLITIEPTTVALPASPKVATLDILHDPTLFALGNPSQASVIIVDETSSYTDFLSSHFPGNTDPALAKADSEGDSVSNLFEYFLGTDPNARSLDQITLVRLDSGRVKISIPADPTATEALIMIEDSKTLNDWNDVTSEFSRHIESAPGNRVIYNYLSNSSVPSSNFYRVKVGVRDGTPQ